MYQRKYLSNASTTFRPCAASPPSYGCSLFMPLTDSEDSLTGVLGNDTVAAGGAATLPSQVLGLMSSVPLPPFDGEAYDGVLGLGFPGAAAPLFSNLPTFFDNLVAAGVLPANEFSLYLDPAQAPGGTAGGGAAATSVFIFGGACKSLRYSSLTRWCVS